MLCMSFRLRPNVLRMRPYVPGRPIDEVKRELGLTDVVKLASNENPLGPSPLAQKAVADAARNMHLYPDAAAHDLRHGLAQHLGVEPNMLAFGNGSDELIHLLGLVFLGQPQDNVVVGDPSFVRYDAAAQLSDVRLTKVAVDEHWRLNLDAMAEACDAHTRLVFVANPNNPTGTLVDHTSVTRLLDRMPPGAALVLDEAYREYAADVPGYPDGLSLIAEGRPVVVMRTFSKAYGLAGLRLGYLVAAPELIDALERAREPFNVNSLAQVAALAALQDNDHLQRSKDVNKEGLARISAAAAGLGLEVLPSYANFACVKVGDAKAVYEALLRQGVIVRPGTGVGMPEFIRVSIGTPAEVSRFLEALPIALGSVTSSS